MTIAHIQQRKFAISRIPQADYVTPTAKNTIPPLSLIRLLVKDKNLAKYSVMTKNNKGYANGSDYATDQWITGHDVTRSFELETATDPLGRILMLALGQVTTDQPDAVAVASAYRHLFKPLDVATTRQLPATTLVEQLGTGVDVLYPSCIAETFSIKGEGIDRISATFGLCGSGKRTKPSTVNFATNVKAATGLKYLYNSEVALTIADAGTLSNATAYGTAKRLESWEISLDNQLLKDDGFRPGKKDYQTAGDQTTGAIRSELLLGDRTTTGNLVVRVDSGSDEYAALQSQKALDLNIKLTGPNIGTATDTTLVDHSLVISAPLTAYEAIDFGEKNGIVTLQIKPTFLFDESTGKIIEFTLINETASYTV